MTTLNRRLVIIIVAAVIVLGAKVALCRPMMQPSTAFAAKHASTTLTLDFAGDCTFGTVNGDGGSGRFPDVYRKSGEVDYPFRRVRRWFGHDDLTVVNFECTLTDANRQADKQWHFKGPASYAKILTSGGVDAVTLANNHAHDYLDQGFIDTVHNFRRADLPAFYQNHPYVTRVKGVRIVLIGDCTVVGENTTDIDGAPTRVLQEIGQYKKPGNLVIVFMHWGSEIQIHPFKWEESMARSFIDAGADAVIGAHPHVLQGIAEYRGHYIAYSLGNFAFGGNAVADHPETAILRLTAQVRHGIPGPLRLSIIPCLTTSSAESMGNGAVVNNYQPTPATGVDRRRIIELIKVRSRALAFGVGKIDHQ